MAEFIEKQEALDGMRQLPHEYKTKEQRARTGGIAACQMVVKNIEPADVRPVVLCKDCDLWNEWDSSGRESLGNYRCSCAEWTTDIATYYTGPDEFCSRGVKRDSDD